MLSELSNPSPCPVLPRARCSVSTSRRLLPAAGGGAGGQIPLQLHGSGPGAGSRLHRSRGGGSSSARPLSPGPGETPPRSLQEDGESCVRVFSVGGRKRQSFISPRCRGQGAGRGRPRKFSFCHHRTKKRMSTTSKMTKRTTIAHHCRRSGKERKHQSFCFSGEGKLGERFSSWAAGNQIQA